MFSDGEDMKKIMTLRRRLRSESNPLLSPSSVTQLLAGNSSADTESSTGGELESEWTYLLTTDEQLNQSVRKEFYYDHVSEWLRHLTPGSCRSLNVLESP